MPRTLTLNAGMVRQQSLACEALKSEKSVVCGIFGYEISAKNSDTTEVLCKI